MIKYILINLSEFVIAFLQILNPSLELRFIFFIIFLVITNSLLSKSLSNAKLIRSLNDSFAYPFPRKSVSPISLPNSASEFDFNLIFTVPIDVLFVFLLL